MSKDKATIVAEYTADGQLKVVEQDLGSSDLIEEYTVNDLFGSIVSGVGEGITGLVDNAGIQGWTREFVTKQYFILSIGHTYLTYLKEEKAKNPGFDTRSHTVAIVQTTFATGAEIAGGAAVGAAASIRTLNPWVIGVSTIGGGAITIFAVDKVKVLGVDSTIIEKVGDIAREAIPDVSKLDKNAPSQRNEVLRIN